MERPDTYLDYEALLARYPDRRFELIHGKAVEKMPTQLHAAIVSLLNFALMLYLREHPIGYALVEARYSLPNDHANARVPDLSFVGRERGPLTRVGAAPYMPDLAVEVQSPGQSARALRDKAAYYLENGTRLVWLIHPETRQVTVLTPGTQQVLSADESLNGGELLPGFSVPVKAVFPAEEGG